MGADVRLVDAAFGIGVKSSWEQALDEVRAAGGTPYPIPAGASDHQLGGLGLAKWAEKVQRQEAELGSSLTRSSCAALPGQVRPG
jgi:1-aminocyclopropane-1-carboxylate deaminase